MRSIVVIAAVAIAAALVVYFGPVDYTGYDARGSLMVSQALLESGHPQLDSYSQADPERTQFVRTNGHVYYFFPIGASLLALPAVAIARAAGRDMNDARDEGSLQRVLSALNVAAVYLLLLGIARRRVPWGLAVVLAAVTVLGSSLTSTVGTAFRSPGAAVLCLALALWEWTRAREAGSPRVWILAPALALACLSRPTSAIPATLLAIWILAERRRAGLSLVTLAVASIAAFLLWNRAETGQWLPAYFQGGRLRFPPTGQALIGNLVSPSRGLFVFSPQLLLVAATPFLRGRGGMSRPLLAFCAAWFLVHWVVVSSFPHWWGGHSYGPRLMLESVLPLGLALIETGRAFVLSGVGLHRPILAALLAGTGLFGLGVHVVQGLYDPATQAWSRHPDIDRHPSRLFDWSEPQWLATRQSVEQNRIRAELEDLRPARPGEPIPPGGKQRAIFENWHRVEHCDQGFFRWSRGDRARLRFAIEIPPGADADRPVRLRIALGSHGEQRIGLYLNGSPLGTIEHAAFAPRTHTFEIPLSRLKRVSGTERLGLDDLNTLAIAVSNPSSSPWWKRAGKTGIGASFWSLEVELRNPPSSTRRSPPESGSAPHWIHRGKGE